MLCPLAPLSGAFDTLSLRRRSGRGQDSPWLDGVVGAEPVRRVASMTMTETRPARGRARTFAGLGVLLLVGVGACSGSATPPTGSITSPGRSTAPAPITSSTGSRSTTGGPAATGTTHPGTSSTGGPTAVGCVDRAVSALTTAQRIGQLLMVGIQPGQAPGGLDGAIAAQHLGGAIYLGGWSGSETVRQTSAHLQAQVTAASTGGVRLLVAADQEGGQVQQLKGSGFTTLPSALAQGQSPATAISANGGTAGRELRSVGVTVDLAPVADTVSITLGRGNGPIGRYDREFGHDPATVSRAVAAFVRGIRSSGVAPTLKHFPGLGRITGNTDTTATGITDTTATAADPNLDPFRQGIAAGAQLVMVSTARYPKLDASNQAAFSHAIVSDLLRGSIGWQGVVVTDDLGAAASVSGIPYADRATRFVAAGGDIVLTATVPSVATMAQGLLARYAAEPAFAAKVEASVRRVLTLKQQLGLLDCG